MPITDIVPPIYKCIYTAVSVTAGLIKRVCMYVYIWKNILALSQKQFAEGSDADGAIKSANCLGNVNDNLAPPFFFFLSFSLVIFFSFFFFIIILFSFCQPLNI